MNDENDFTNSQMRREAEKLLNEKHRKNAEELRDADVKKLVHELQVHQIELEMQNEELRRAHEIAETALKKYTMLFDLAPLGYFSLDSEGTICDLNYTGADMLGDRRFSLINSNFKLFIDKDSIPVFNNFFKKVYTTNSKESCKVMLGYENEQLNHVYMEGVVTEDEHKCLLSVVNISKFTI
jgi:PAS domain-containing protein